MSDTASPDLATAYGDVPALEPADDGSSTRRRWEGRLATVLMLIPVAALILQAVTWVRYGIDVPAFDDWRQYIRGWEGSFDPAELFEASNGTVSAVGRAIDSVVYVAIAGNVVVYELLSMVALLGAILFLQWRLLRQAVRDVLAFAAVFLLTLASLRTGTLWGHATMAFQQGLPIVLILTATWLVLKERPSGRIGPVLVLILGLVAGLTYISGAFAATAVSVVLLLAAYLGPDPGRRLLHGGSALLAAGLITILIQLVLVFGSGEVDDAVAATGFTMPWDARFWAYLLGLVGGSMWPPLYSNSDREVLASAVAAGVGLVAAGIACIWALRVLLRRTVGDDGRRIAAIMLLSIAVACAVYVGLAAAARTQYDVPAGSPLLDYVHSGRMVHRPFWTTLLWPWVGAAFVLILMQARTTRRWLPAPGPTAVIVSTLLIVAVWTRGAFDYDRWYAIAADFRADVQRCLVTRLSEDEPLHCQLGVEFGAVDLTDPVIRAMTAGASFTRALQLGPAPASQPTMFASSIDVPGTIAATPASVTGGIGGYHVEGPAPARIRIVTGRDAALVDCRLLEVAVRIRTELPDFVALLWSDRAEPSRERGAASFPIPDGDGHALHFFLPSVSGFSDSFTIWTPTLPADIDDVATPVPSERAGRMTRSDPRMDGLRRTLDPLPFRRWLRPWPAFAALLGLAAFVFTFMVTYDLFVLTEARRLILESWPVDALRWLLFPEPNYGPGRLTGMAGFQVTGAICGVDGVCVNAVGAGSGRPVRRAPRHPHTPGHLERPHRHRRGGALAALCSGARDEHLAVGALRRPRLHRRDARRHPLVGGLRATADDDRLDPGRRAREPASSSPSRSTRRRSPTTCRSRCCCWPSCAASAVHARSCATSCCRSCRSATACGSSPTRSRTCRRRTSSMPTAAGCSRGCRRSCCRAWACTGTSCSCGSAARSTSGSSRPPGRATSCSASRSPWGSSSRRGETAAPTRSGSAARDPGGMPSAAPARGSISASRWPSLIVVGSRSRGIAAYYMPIAVWAFMTLILMAIGVIGTRLPRRLGAIAAVALVGLLVTIQVTIYGSHWTDAGTYRQLIAGSGRLEDLRGMLDAAIGDRPVDRVAWRMSEVGESAYLITQGEPVTLLPDDDIWPWLLADPDRDADVTGGLGAAAEQVAGDLATHGGPGDVVIVTDRDYVPVFLAYEGRVLWDPGSLLG